MAVGFTPIHPEVVVTDKVQNLIKINGINITPKVINYIYEQTWGDAISELEIDVVQTISDILSIQVGQTVEVYRAFVNPPDIKIFSGYIESFQPDGGKIKIICKDKLWDLVRKEITYIYDKDIDGIGGVLKLSNIFLDLITTAGLNADSTTIQDSGSDLTMNQFICNYSDIMDRCKTLASTLDWQFYYRADEDKVYFENKGFTSNPKILTVGSEIISVPKWNKDTTEMVNELTVLGANQGVETTETGQIGVTIGYLTTGIVVNFEPSSVKVYLDASNPPTTLKIGGVPESSITYDYYVDKANKKIIPKDGTAFTTNNYAQINYTYNIPRSVLLINADSITNYGQFKKTITYTDIRSVEDAQNRGQNYLDRYSQPFNYATIKVKNSLSYSYRVGDLIRIIDNINQPNVDGFFIVTRIISRYPTDYDELTVGDKTWRLSAWQESVETRIKRIEEDKTANVVNPNKLVSIDNTALLPIQIVPRYRRIYTDNGSGEVIAWVGQYENYYEENFIDTDFKDASTTATWTTTGEVTF
jgi:hypothetical protein